MMPTTDTELTDAMKESIMVCARSKSFIESCYVVELEAYAPGEGQRTQFSPALPCKPLLERNARLKSELWRFTVQRGLLMTLVSYLSSHNVTRSVYHFDQQEVTP